METTLPPNITALPHFLPQPYDHLNHAHGHSCQSPSQVRVESLFPCLLSLFFWFFLSRLLFWSTSAIPCTHSRLLHDVGSACGIVFHIASIVHKLDLPILDTVWSYLTPPPPSPQSPAGSSHTAGKNSHRFVVFEGGLKL